MRDRRARSAARPGFRDVAVAAVAALLLGCGVSGCSVARAVHKVADTVHSNSSIIDVFTAKLKSGQPDRFEVTYVTTGSSPSKVVYAVRPPDDLAFTDSAAGSGAPVSYARLIVNSAGVFGCTGAPSSGGDAAAAKARWSCQKLPKEAASTQKAILDFYTPAHWVSFLKEFSLAAGFAGDKLSTSTMTVNGFPMSCVDFVASGVAGTSKICTTAQHLLGYVNVASSSTDFEITSYSGSPSARLFTLPGGAKITVANLPENGNG
jgi:hypothetical protein